MLYPFLFVLVIFIGNVKSDLNLCAGRNVTSQYVIDYCSSQNGSLIHRCCRSFDESTFLAVDLMDFNFTEVPDFHHFVNMNLSVIDLRNNSQLKPSNNNDFASLQSLDQLLLPEQFDCPGGHRIWEIIDKISDPTGNLCMHQRDFCLNSSDVCMEKDSYCSTNGPNQFLCLCTDGYHGYKCLRYGTFPSAIIFGSIAVATVVASVLLYWTQRRYVKK